MLKHEVNDVKLDISSSRDGVEGKSTLDVWNGYATQNLPQIGKEEGIGMDGLIEDFGIDKRMCEKIGQEGDRQIIQVA